MNEVIRADLYRYSGKSGYKGLIRSLFNPCFRYIFYMRKVNSSRKYSIKRFLFMYLKRRCSVKYGFIIATPKVGKGFYIGHPGTIIINPQAIIGENCNITHNVTIGQTNRGVKKGTPIIGNKVWIGTGAVIVGKITIGNNVLIAPNSYVNIDIPDNSLVLGNPCKIISKNDACKGYINYVLN